MALVLSRQIFKIGCNFSGYGLPPGILATTANPAVVLGGVRCKYTKRPSQKVASKDPEGVHYHGFSYFPRFPGEKDPPVTPTKLFMVKRIRSLSGCPWWEKDWIRKMHLEDRRSVAIVKNCPTANKWLYKIKHLVEITPITTPYGLPDGPNNAFLKENGEFVSHNLLQEHGDATLEEGEKALEEYRKKHIGGKTLGKRLHEQWYSRFDIVK